MRTLFTLILVFISPIVVAPTIPKEPIVMVAEKEKPDKDYYAFLDALGHQE